MKNIILICILIMYISHLAAQYACASPTELEGESKPLLVSLIDVIANKDIYHNKQVYLVGYIRLRDEDCAIYLSKNDATHSISKNGLWVGFDDALLKKERILNYNGKYVMILGVFNKNEKGHMGLFSGKIESISRIRVRK